MGDGVCGGVFRSEAASHRLMPVVAAGVKRYAPGLSAHWIGSPHHTAGCSFFCRVIQQSDVMRQNCRQKTKLQHRSSLVRKRGATMLFAPDTR